MSAYDERLRQLEELRSRRSRVEARARELRANERELEEKTQALEKAAFDRRLKLEKLEGRSMASLFAALAGKRTERLEAARAASRAADAEYENAAQGLDALRRELRLAEEDCDRVRNVGARYAAVLEEKAGAIISSEGDGAQALRDADSAIDGLERELKELDEAVAAGQKALNTARGILSSLDDARGWSTVDLLGGGLISDVAKHDHLDSAQEQLDQLKKDLHAFGKELGELHIDAELQLNIDGFMLFADFFFDGLLADWAVRDRIVQSQEQMNEVKSRISGVLDRLNGSRAVLEKKLARERDMRRRIIEEAKLGDDA